MNNSNEKDEPVGFQVIPRQSQSIKLLQRKSTYLIVMTTVCLVILSASAYSYWRYHSGSALSSPLQPFLPIHAGQIHYSRIPKEYWQHRILMIKAMGFNSLSVYVMWNYHETSKGQFDYKNDNKDLPWFLELAKKHQMKVLIRPGPYVCGEWDFGGLPARLLGIDGLKIRQADKIYEDQVRQYFANLAKVITPFLYKNGGPIILLQIENELGYYKVSPEHMSNIRAMWKGLKIQCEFYYQQPFRHWKDHYWPDAHIGLSGGDPGIEFHLIQASSRRTNHSIFFGGEVYSGWITFWGLPWGSTTIKRFGEKFTAYVTQNRSISVYVAVGGTNFGLTAGSNGLQDNDGKTPNFRPQITSYDYDALITQQGRVTQKYFNTRDTLQQYYGHKFIEIPKPIPAISVPAFKPNTLGHLWANLPQTPTLSKSDLTFFESNALKMYNQGMAVYQTQLAQKGWYRLSATIHDNGFVFLDQQYIGSFIRKMDDKHVIEVSCQSPPCKLKILVEAMGHINFGEDINQDRKGLLQLADLQRPSYNFRWDIYKIEIADALKWTKKSSAVQFPLLLSGSFELKETGDTYLDMSSYGKGYLWVNGHLLGRYWSIGPQQRLYCPGVWVKNGTNTVHILQLLQSGQGRIAGYEKLLD